MYVKPSQSISLNRHAKILYPYLDINNVGFMSQILYLTPTLNNGSGKAYDPNEAAVGSYDRCRVPVERRTISWLYDISGGPRLRYRPPQARRLLRYR